MEFQRRASLVDDDWAFHRITRRVVTRKWRRPQRGMRCGNIRQDEWTSTSRSFSSWSAGGGSRNSPRPLAARDGGCWAVTGFRRWARVRVDRLERRDAWAEAVRLALMAAAKRRPFLAAPADSTMRGSPEDPTAFDEERMRLRAMGWSFSEHKTVQQSGRVGWVVSGTRHGRRIRALDDDRSDAWGTALILAGVTFM